MRPPFRRAGSARPSVTCYTDEDPTSATQPPYGSGYGVVVAAARTHPRRICHQSLTGASRLVDTEVRARTGRKMRGIYAG
jgi:hypothetical protein